MMDERYRINIETLLQLVKSAEMAIAVVMNAANQSNIPEDERNQLDGEIFVLASLAVTHLWELAQTVEKASQRPHR